MAALAAVLEESADVSKKASAVCDHHAGIVDRMETQNTIISFNYDRVQIMLSDAAAIINGPPALLIEALFEPDCGGRLPE